MKFLRNGKKKIGRFHMVKSVLDWSIQSLHDSAQVHEPLITTMTIILVIQQRISSK
jgi:hypothetical protein